MMKAIILTLLMINSAIAEDSLSALMHRMKSASVVKLKYQEMRSLELFDQAWHGNGNMYATADGMMLREQLKPNRLLMAVNKQDLFYYDTKNNIRHQSTMQDSDSLTLQFAVFQALINADESLLNRLYEVDFVSKSKRWLMKLTPKQAELGLSITVSGPLLKKVDTIIIKQADGDLSEFMLQTDETLTTDQISKTVEQLYTELVGE